MAVSPPKPCCHTFVSYFWVFQMSGIRRVFGLQLWNLAVLLISTCSFSLVDEMKFMQISSRHFACEKLRWGSNVGAGSRGSRIRWLSTSCLLKFGFSSPTADDYGVTSLVFTRHTFNEGEGEGQREREREGEAKAEAKTDRQRVSNSLFIFHFFFIWSVNMLNAWEGLAHRQKQITSISIPARWFTQTFTSSNPRWCRLLLN